MHWLALLAGCLALILARVLRAPLKSYRLTGFAWFFAALLITGFAIRIGAESQKITRPTEYDSFVVHAADLVREDPDAPLVVFLGASFTRNALDDEELTRRLRAKGYPHRVINLSLQGASLQERDQSLWDFMRLTQRAPDVAFLEVADEFDRDPAYVFNVAKFSDRAIKQVTPNAAYWSVKGLSQGQCDGMASCVKAWAFLGIHAVMNWSNIGLLATGESIPDIEAVPAFDPQDTPRDTFTLSVDEIRAALEVPAEVTPSNGPSWARLFRMDQRDRLMQAGVRRVAYYYPPVISPDEREYVADLCAGELSAFPCIAPVDRTLLAQLERPVWFDDKHLLRDGADVYTDWLAGQIDQWGALK
ncbi:hypothetical protein [Ponticaulis profundi]|uniref:SGNH/GDSL hydrolase family protein n=1 Tax=Ponticaulis profundi TaxID=2665222 RepID=A0ABW1SBK0_9PROT